MNVVDFRCPVCCTYFRLLIGNPRICPECAGEPELYLEFLAGEGERVERDGEHFAHTLGVEQRMLPDLSFFFLCFF